MSGRILIVDTVATNRIVLKVKMLTALFTVDACGNQFEAEALIATQRPDLILINLTDPVEDRHRFCQALKTDPDTTHIAIIAIGVADTTKARFAALDAGADDVLPHPINDALLLARIRSLMRVRNASQELFLRDSTSRALGFEEPCARFETAAHIVLISRQDTRHAALSEKLSEGLGQTIETFNLAGALKQAAATAVPELFIIDCGRPHANPTKLFRLVSDLRSRTDTRQSTILIVVPDGEPDMAAMFLDLGADDIVSCSASAGELKLRAKALINRKRLSDRLRDTVRDGLHAAITDPLTGLYNRRYVEPHLARMAEQARQAGQELTVMMMDIDHFKVVNDTYGHAAGDKVLVELANRLRGNLRSVDLVARMGGEEFLVAMPRTPAAQAHGAADRLRKLVNGQPFDIGEGMGPLRITVSVGVSVSAPTTIEEEHLDKMFGQADAALYAAKSAGRDQVAMSKSAA